MVGCRGPGGIPVSMDARERVLIEINTDDILAALGWDRKPVVRAAARLAARGPALVFAREIRAFDDDIARRGITEAAGSLLDRHVSRCDVSGAEGIPPRGPVLILSNHPGMTDTLALLAAIPRADLKVLAADRPFLRAIPAAARSLIFIPDQKEHRVAAVHQAIDHLSSGGALLTFPAGEIEPDPAVLPGAEDSALRWGSSALLFLRRVPETSVVPVVVSGVLAPGAQRHPFTLLRKRGAERERLAAMLQVVTHTFFPGIWRVRVAVDFLAPLEGRAFAEAGDSTMDVITTRVRSHLRGQALPGWPARGRRR